MEQLNIDEMAGRIDGLARALLQLTAALEKEQIIDGPRLSQAWRGAVSDLAEPKLQASRRVLLEMAERLDEARAFRQSTGRP